MHDSYGDISQFQEFAHGVDTATQRARNRTALVSSNQFETHDGITGLHNRGSGEKLLADAHELSFISNVPYSVLRIDINYFKRIVDIHGHQVGNAVIKVVAELLSSDLRAKDSVCRWGGYEFLCILKEADEKVAKIVADRIQASVNLVRVLVAGQIAVSIGASTWTESALDAASLIKAADRSLDESKQKSQNPVVGIQEPNDIDAVEV